MKKTICLVLIFILAVCAGCNAAPSAAEPEPATEPEGQLRVFGKDITVALLSGSDMFSYGVGMQADALGIDLRIVDSIEDASGTDIIIAYMPDEEQLEIAAMPVIAYTNDASLHPATGSSIVYDADSELEAALDVMFTYVSHEAPVRIVCMYEGGPDSAPALAVARMNEEGKLYIKGEISAEESGGADEAVAQLETLLADIVPGLLDTLFTSDAELAMAAYDVLEAAKRSDAVEVITAGLNMDIVAAMINDHFLMGAAVGANEQGAGALAVRMAVEYLAGGRVEDVMLAPFALYSDDVIAATADAYDGMPLDEVLLALDEQTGALYQTHTVEYLAEYYE